MNEEKKQGKQKYWVVIDTAVILVCFFLLFIKLMDFVPKRETKTEDEDIVVQTTTLSEINQVNEATENTVGGEQSMEPTVEEEQTEEVTISVAVTEGELNRGEYLIADSSTRLISEDELTVFSDWELQLARNEIYAKHGRKFKTEAIQEYFNTKSWYQGRIEPDDFDDINMLNQIEKDNLNIILAVEAKRNGNSSDVSESVVVVTQNKELNLRNLGISDLTPYCTSSTVTTLWCSGNLLKDVNALVNMTQLTDLDISNNNISDISCLKNLTNLEKLAIGENPIADISVVVNFPNLKALDFWKTDVRDIQVLAGLTQLEEVYMSYSQVNTLAPIINLPNIKILSIRDLVLPQVEYNEFVRLHPDCKIYQEGLKLY